MDGWLIAAGGIVGAGIGGAVAWSVAWSWLLKAQVRLAEVEADLDVARMRLAASMESTVDMGYLMDRQRETYREQIGTYDQILSITLSGADALMRERDEARAASRLALTFYGRELERREAVDAELARERIVSEGLARWTGMGS